MTDQMEARQLAAIAFDLDKLKTWYENEKVEPYKDDRWHKVFKKGGPLEWLNPASTLDGIDYWGHGVETEWTQMENVRSYCAETGKFLIE